MIPLPPLRFSAEFDFRTYDNEGVILYAESSNNTGWFLLALRDGKIEIQFKNEHGTKVTSGGKAINDGVWQTVSWLLPTLPSSTRFLSGVHTYAVVLLPTSVNTFTLTQVDGSTVILTHNYFYSTLSSTA